MKRYWALMLTAATLASCRTAQPTTNPFLQTTVPPPSNTPGVVMTPGQPYAQGITPPVVTTPAPATAPPAVTQPVPVTPAPPPAAPLTAPPSVAPQGDEFHPPGGSFLYHQSSNETQPSSVEPQRIQLAGGPQAAIPVGGVAQATHVEPGPVRLQSSMTPANMIYNPYVNRTPPAAASSPAQPAAPAVASSPPAPRPPMGTVSPPAAPAPLQARTQSPKARPLQPAPHSPAATKLAIGGSRGDPPELPSAMTVAASTPQNSLRIVGESAASAQPSMRLAPASGTQASLSNSGNASPSSDGTVLRITAGAPQGAIRSTAANSTSQASAKTAFVPVNANTTSTARFVTPSSTSPGVVQAAFQPAGANASAADQRSSR